MLFAETSGSNKSYLHSLFFVFAVDEAFLVNLYSKTGDAVTLFGAYQRQPT